MSVQSSDLARALVLDATDPLLTETQLRTLAIRAQDAGLYAICALPVRVAQTTLMLSRALVRTHTLIGYPTGAHTASAKGLETRLALQEGAQSVAVVPYLGYFLGGEEQHARNEIGYVAKAVRGVAPLRARELSAVFDLDQIPPDQIANVAAIVLGSGAYGVYLIQQQAITVDAVRSTLRLIGNRSTTAAVTLHAPVADAETARAMLHLGVDYVVTPHAVELAHFAAAEQAN